LRTDHAAIVNIVGTNSLSYHFQRWKLALPGERLQAYHLPGNQNVIPNVLSCSLTEILTTIPLTIGQLLTQNPLENNISLSKLRTLSASKKAIAASSNPGLFVMSPPKFSCH
jgi:hypothetical protein